MHNEDLDKNMGRDSSSGASSSRSRSSSDGSMSSDRERMKNRDQSDSDMDESGEDLQRKQSEGNLGNERVRGGYSDDDMRGSGE